jgi:hypothetical protein
MFKYVATLLSEDETRLHLILYLLPAHRYESNSHFLHPLTF